VWVEPSAGNGAIIRAVNTYLPTFEAWANYLPTWRAFEIREEEREILVELCGARARIENFLHVQDAPDLTVSTVIGNPPYSFAFEFLMKCKFLYPMAEIVFLLRQAFTASQERYAFMSEHWPDKLEFPDRISFDGEGADSADYAWMRWPVQWERRRGETLLLRQTPLEERQRDRGHKVVIEPPQLGLFT
jgi:hypothetical protein